MVHDNKQKKLKRPPIIRIRKNRRKNPYSNCNQNAEKDGGY